MEQCQICGKKYETVYSVPNEIWERIIPKEGEAGLLCIECADMSADVLGIKLYWSAKEYKRLLSRSNG